MTYSLAIAGFGIALQTSAGSIAGGLLGGLAAYVPILLKAALILLVGIVVGRFVDSRVYRYSWQARFDEHAEGTVVDAIVGDAEDAVSEALSATAKYLVYVTTAIVAVDALRIGLLQQLSARAAAYLPNALTALAVLAGGLLAGWVIGRVVTRLGARLGIDTVVFDTTLGRALGVEGASLSGVLGTAAEYYVYLVATFVAVGELGLTGLVEFLRSAVYYAPSLVGGFLSIAIGALVAERVGDAVTGSEAARRTPAPELLGGATQAVLYVFAFVIGLDALGVATPLLETLLLAVLLPVGLAVALAVGLAVGYGGRDHVGEYLDRWSGAPADPAPSDD